MASNERLVIENLEKVVGHLRDGLARAEQQLTEAQAQLREVSKLAGELKTEVVGLEAHLQTVTQELERLKAFTGAGTEPTG